MAVKTLRRSFPLDQDGSRLKIGLVSAHAHADVVGALVLGTKKALLERGVACHDLRYSHVARPFDLPFAAKAMLQCESNQDAPSDVEDGGGEERRGLDAVICLGCIIRDDLPEQFEFESESVALGIMKLNLKGPTPVIYAVLTCENKEQALRFVGAKDIDRSGSEYVKDDHGWEWAKTAIHLAQFTKSLREDCA